MPFRNGEQKSLRNHRLAITVGKRETGITPVNEEMRQKLHFRFKAAWFVSHENNLPDLQTLSVTKFYKSMNNKSYHSHGVAFLLVKIVIHL